MWYLYHNDRTYRAVPNLPDCMIFPKYSINVSIHKFFDDASEGWTENVNEPDRCIKYFPLKITPDFLMAPFFASGKTLLHLMNK